MNETNRTPLIAGIVILVLIIAGVLFYKNRTERIDTVNTTTTTTTDTIYTAPMDPAPVGPMDAGTLNDASQNPDMMNNGTQPADATPSSGVNTAPANQ